MYKHTPVLLHEVCHFMRPASPGNLVIDATLGEGGYSARFLDEFPGITLIGIERDLEILSVARQRLSEFGERVQFFHMWFDDFFSDYHHLVQGGPDRIVFDLGISRFHYEAGKRGFAFSKDEPLDMRLTRETPESACDIVNTYPEADLADLFFQFGEERFSRQIARAIVRERKNAPVKTTKTLSEIIRKAVPKKARYNRRIHPATRCFQALRIAVNSELDRLKRALEAAFQVLCQGGRILVVTYHSLEDRIVKQFFKEKNSVCTCPPDWPICQCRGVREADILTRKPVQPGADEIAGNRAARSAKLRVAEKIMPGEAV